MGYRGKYKGSGERGYRGNWDTGKRGGMGESIEKGGRKINVAERGLGEREYIRGIWGNYGGKYGKKKRRKK